MLVDGIKICQLAQIIKNLKVHLKFHIVHFAFSELQFGKYLLICYDTSFGEQKLLLRKRRSQHTIELFGSCKKGIILEGIGPSMRVSIVSLEDIVV